MEEPDVVAELLVAGFGEAVEVGHHWRCTNRKANKNDKVAVDKVAVGKAGLEPANDDGVDVALDILQQRMGHALLLVGKQVLLKPVVARARAGRAVGLVRVPGHDAAVLEVKHRGQRTRPRVHLQVRHLNVQLVLVLGRVAHNRKGMLVRDGDLRHAQEQVVTGEELELLAAPAHNEDNLDAATRTRGRQLPHVAPHALAGAAAPQKVEDGDASDDKEDHPEVRVAEDASSAVDGAGSEAGVGAPHVPLLEALVLALGKQVVRGDDGKHAKSHEDAREPGQHPETAAEVVNVVKVLEDDGGNAASWGLCGHAWWEGGGGSGGGGAVVFAARAASHVAVVGKEGANVPANVEEHGNDAEPADVLVVDDEAAVGAREEGPEHAALERGVEAVEDHEEDGGEEDVKGGGTDTGHKQAVGGDGGVGRVARGRAAPSCEAEGDEGDDEDKRHGAPVAVDKGVDAGDDGDGLAALQALDGEDGARVVPQTSQDHKERCNNKRHHLHKQELKHLEACISVLAVVLLGDLDLMFRQRAREVEREREGGREGRSEYVRACVCVCVRFCCFFV